MIKERFSAGIRILIEARIPVFIKVKGYTRIRFGKKEKVRSYYRRVWDAE